ncbi:hypothetical protein BGX28_001755 [Mortierella sp. GBA30]|nr:hypothetical protein BGX28_001755 [Mortierella sp. GBA30]
MREELKTDVSQTVIRIKNAQYQRMLYDNKDKGLVSWDETTNADGYWYLTPVTDRYYKIKNSLSGNCIYYNVDSKKPVSWRDTANSDGQWAIVKSSSPYKFQIKNVEANVYLSVNTADAITTTDDHNNAESFWSFV